MAYIRNITTAEVIVIAYDGDSMTMPPKSLVLVDDKFTFKLNPRTVRVVEPTDIPNNGSGTGSNVDNLPTYIPPNSVINTQGTPNSLTSTVIDEGEILGRLPGGALEGIKISQLPVDVDTVEFTVNLTEGSMLLATLPSPADDDSIEAFINGISLSRDHDFTVSGNNLIATVELNESYNGTGTDGQGFDNSDECRVTYRVKTD